MSRSRDLANLANNATGLETLTVSDITDLTATAQELNYTDGVGSAIQTQINAKAPIASPTFTGTTNVSSGVTFPTNPTITLGSNATFPSGHIIQVVHDELPSGLVSTTNATIANSSMSITLSSASHYVLIFISGASYRDGGGSGHHQYLTLNGGGFGSGYNSNSSTTDSLLQAAYNYQFNDASRDGWAHSRLDTNPGGTSVTYTLHGLPQNDGGGTVTIRYSDVNYTLMEIRP